MFKQAYFFLLFSDSILIFPNPHCSAKLCDFTCSIEVNDLPDYDAKKLDEFNRFGLVSFLFIEAYIFRTVLLTLPILLDLLSKTFEATIVVFISYYF